MKRQSCHHIEASQLISRANQLTRFYTMATLAFNDLKLWQKRQCLQRPVSAVNPSLQRSFRNLKGPNFYSKAIKL